jgi:hypothetical protein
MGFISGVYCGESTCSTSISTTASLRPAKNNELSEECSSWIWEYRSLTDSTITPTEICSYPRPSRWFYTIQYKGLFHGRSNLNTGHTQDNRMQKSTHQEHCNAVSAVSKLKQSLHLPNKRQICQRIWLPHWLSSPTTACRVVSLEIIIRWSLKLTCSDE